ncbi:biotin--[acetyl-CoA-carboxylase] ligase [Novosphingobium sp. PY1]|uniref:Biotin--[acetyl-CoA-carboxylase] ligase n=1 Tax=Ochrobactrum sp. PW1 TaxID=1882222 RepID=A0A292GS74_9HYPH|nr:biotin--[acetyl-CoA-carboxylase] ligase [Ochrobactrum sp. PW1]GFM29178.1 biotin--[acetyl-CoA-carboxylase] ligase [Novosphingobium sp. PY1]
MDQVWLLTLQTDTLFEGLRPANGLGDSMWVQGAGMEREWCGLARDDTDEAVGSETSVALADDGFEATVRHIAPSAAALEHRSKASGLRILPCGDV